MDISIQYRKKTVRINKHNETWYEYLREDNVKLRKTYKKGGYKARDPKVPKNSTFGPASECIVFTPEEIAQYEKDRS